MREGEAFEGLDPTWPPLASIRRGWAALGPEAHQEVIARVRKMRRVFEPPAEVNQAALRRFLSFLAQVETVAIDVPLMSMPEADETGRAMLEEQLTDEVFHALGFAHLATAVGGLADPLPEAEAVLARIRAPEDARVRHVLLNLIAEDWIETLFEHAATWGVADPVFRMVLADEARHVHEGHHHAADIHPQALEAPVRALEEALFALMQSPRLALPTLALAGAEGTQALSRDYLETHRAALDGLGLEPPEGFMDMLTAIEELQSDSTPLQGDRGPASLEAPRRLEPESQWRRTALHLWNAPRHPVMHGWFDAQTEHIPTELLTPVMVAAIGQVWHEYPRMNRFTLGGELYEPADVNVGVRVAIGDTREALSTIVVPEAHRRSVQDIQRILAAGVQEMERVTDELGEIDPGQAPGSLREILTDDELMALVPPETVAAPVTVSNVGSAGLVAGTGAMPGALGQSVEFIIGREEERPVWDGQRYVPGRTVTIGASADHRVIDGHHAGQAMDRLRQRLSEDGVAEIMARPDTVPADAPLEEVHLAGTGVSRQNAQLLLSCKVPFWLAWICWLFKK